MIEKKVIIDFLSELKPELKKDGIVAIGLFGSYASKKNTVYSDIDIAIKKENGYLFTHSPYDYFETVAKLRSTLMHQFHRNIDIFDLDSSSSLKSTIERELVYV